MARSEPVDEVTGPEGCLRVPEEDIAPDAAHHPGRRTGRVEGFGQLHPPHHRRSFGDVDPVFDRSELAEGRPSVETDASGIERTADPRHRVEGRKQRPGSEGAPEELFEGGQVTGRGEPARHQLHVGGGEGGFLPQVDHHLELTEDRPLPRLDHRRLLRVREGPHHVAEGVEARGLLGDRHAGEQSDQSAGDDREQTETHRKALFRAHPIKGYCPMTAIRGNDSGGRDVTPGCRARCGVGRSAPTEGTSDAGTAGRSADVEGV